VFEAEDVLDGLIRGALSGRRKSWSHAGRALRGSGIVNPTTLLAAAGVAWGLFETWQQQQQTQKAPATAGSGGTPLPPLPGAAQAPPPLPVPPPATASSLPPAVLLLLRLMISAARADGEIGPAERERILAEAREVGADAEVQQELASPRPLTEIVAGVSDPELKEQLYALAFTIVRADEAVTGGERIYLAQLAHRLALDAAAVARLEQQAASRIDAAAAQA